MRATSSKMAQKLYLHPIIINFKALTRCMLTEGTDERAMRSFRSSFDHHDEKVSNFDQNRGLVRLEGLDLAMLLYVLVIMAESSSETSHNASNSTYSEHAVRYSFEIDDDGE